MSQYINKINKIFKRHSHKIFIIYMILILIIGIICIFRIQKRTSIGIASYDTYVNPKPRLTKQFNPRYKYRFEPNKNSYLDHKSIKVALWEKHEVPTPTKTNPNNNQHARVKTRIIRRHVIIHHKHTFFFRHFLRKPTFLRKHTRRYSRKHVYAATIVKKVIRQERIYINPKYTIHNTPHSKIVYLNNNYPIWSQPYKATTKLVSSTNELYSHHQAVKIVAVAHSNKHQFYHIISGGYDYGWVERPALLLRKMYQIPFHYYSQLQPYYAPDACEAVALRMALSVKGRNPRVSMKQFIKRIPRNKNPNKGYTHSPLKLGDHAAIFPTALAAYAKRYDAKAYPYTGISKKALISNLEQGNPIIYEGSYQMRDIDSDHTLILIGYCQGQLEFADPYYKKGWPKPISWVSIKKFTKLFHQPLRGARAVVVK